MRKGRGDTEKGRHGDEERRKGDWGMRITE